MATTRVRFTFPPDLVSQPVVYNMGKQYHVVINIRRANIAHDRGWMVLELIGTEDDVQKALAWAKDQGVRVEPVDAEATT